MFYYGAWVLYSLNEYCGPETITITSVHVTRYGNICINFTAEALEGEESSLYFSPAEMDKLFSKYLVYGQYVCLVGKTFEIDFEITFCNEDGTECCEPNAFIEGIKEVTSKNAD